MSNISVSSLIESFPYVLSHDEEISLLASLVAEELMDLWEKDNLAAIYTRIDELDSELLDILAVDFKVDWWDADADVDEKRKTFKAHWEVHRKLGTPGAVRTAISTIYESTDIEEWFDYGGEPYHYRILINLGKEWMNDEKFQCVLQRARFYVNLRSVLESVVFHSERQSKIYVGTAGHYGERITLMCEGLPSGIEWYETADGDPYVDKFGNIYERTMI